jgi:hypothetical protein
MIIEELSICAPNSKIVTNYTYTSATRKGPVGQYEILEDIESNSNILVNYVVLLNFTCLSCTVYELIHALRLIIFYFVSGVNECPIQFLYRIPVEDS